MSLKKTILLISIWTISFQGIGQDIHFSQVTNFPLLINPAYTGMYSAQSRAVFAARNQNIAVPNTAFTGVYNTVGASFETKMFPNQEWSNTWSVGVMGLADYAGSGTLATHQLLASTSYSLALDRYGRSALSFGAQAGFITRRLFSHDLLFESQVSGYSFDPKLPNMEPFLDGSVHTSFLMNIGTIYQQQIGDMNLLQLGFSIYNVNSPGELFYFNSSSNIYSRVNLHGGFLLHLDEDSRLFPSIVYIKQGPASQLNAGMSYLKDVSDDVSIIAGLRMRMGDAFIPLAGLRYRNLQATMSYDFTTSSLATANKSSGAIELNIQLLFGTASELQKSQKTYCPSL